jgi:glycosyltransferase involved in cell wall biosynthesis
MNKLLIIGQLPPPYHGSNVMTKVMIEAVKQSKNTVFFIDKMFSKNVETVGKISFRKLLRVPVLILQIIMVCKKIKPNLCVFFIAAGKTAFLVDALLLIVLRLCKTKYVLRFGGKSYKKLQLEGKFWYFIVKYSLSNALGAIVLGDCMKNDVNSCILNSRLITVYNGVERPQIVNDKKVYKYIQVVYLGNLIPTKGPFEVLKAAKIALEKNKKLRFILAGGTRSEAFTNQLKSFINNNGLDPYVKLPGVVKGKGKSSLLNSSHIFVFPSYFEREVFGTVNVEAMSYGLPVITSSEGAISEIVKDGKTGFIVNPKSPQEIADKILLLAENHSMREAMSKNARRAYEEKFSLKVHASNINKAISQFIKIGFSQI